MKVSVCIPTYNRPDFLKEAVLSCINQIHLPSEILIGDDSSNDHTEDLVKQLISGTTVNIRYFHNRPSLKQAANVNYLFDKVEGDLAVLLHDDDTLLPHSFKCLVECFDKYPDIDVAFGKQYIMYNDGSLDKDGSEKLNKSFYRSAKFVGSTLSSLEAGFLQQFPNDGYMIRSEILRKIKYRENIGDACDFDFGLRLGINSYKMHFVDTYTANYRLSHESISNNPGFDGGFTAFELVAELDVPTESERYKEIWLKDKASVAIMQAAKLRKNKRALQIYFSRWHKRKILSLGGIKRLFLILHSCLSPVSSN